MFSAVFFFHSLSLSFSCLVNELHSTGPFHGNLLIFVVVVFCKQNVYIHSEPNKKETNITCCILNSMMMVMMMILAPLLLNSLKMCGYDYDWDVLLNEKIGIQITAAKKKNPPKAIRSVRNVLTNLEWEFIVELSNRVRLHSHRHTLTILHFIQCWNSDAQCSDEFHKNITLHKYHLPISAQCTTSKLSWCSFRRDT